MKKNTGILVVDKKVKSRKAIETFSPTATKCYILDQNRARENETFSVKCLKFRVNNPPSVSAERNPRVLKKIGIKLRYRQQN